MTATPSFPLTCNGTDLEGTVRKIARRWGAGELDTSQVYSGATEANSEAVRHALAEAKHMKKKKKKKVPQTHVLFGITTCRNICF